MRLIEWPPHGPSRPLVVAPVAILLLASCAVLAYGDQALFLLLNTAGTAFPPDLWAAATQLGDTLVATCLLVVVAHRRPEVVWAVLVAALVATLYTRGLKPLLDVPRPPSVLTSGGLVVIGPVLRSGSFPSGHSATIATLCGVLAIHSASTSFRVTLALLAVFVGLSRIMVGAHWPLDVIFGLLGGWLSACLGAYLYARRPFWRGSLAHQIQLGILLALAVATIVFASGYPDAVWVSRVLGGLAALSAAVGLWTHSQTPGRVG